MIREEDYRRQNRQWRWARRVQDDAGQEYIEPVTIDAVPRWVPLTHHQIVRIVAEKLSQTWSIGTEIVCMAQRPRRRGKKRPSKYRIADLVATCQGYVVAFEIKANWSSYRVEVGWPEKHAPAAQMADEFYFVLPAEHCRHTDDVPKDAGLMVLTKENELRILKPAPRRPVKLRI